MHPAIENLKTAQRILDGAGVEVAVSRQALDEALTLHDNMNHACELARTALDGLMGDSDLPDDDSPEMKAMQALNMVLGIEDEDNRAECPECGRTDSHNHYF
jgi:hypothetical protein